MNNTMQHTEPEESECPYAMHARFTMQAIGEAYVEKADALKALHRHSKHPHFIEGRVERRDTHEVLYRITAV